MGDKWHQPGGVRGDWRVTGAAQVDGQQTIAGALALTGSLLVEIDADSHDLAPSGFDAAAVLRLDPSAAYNLTGLDSTGVDTGRFLVLININSSDTLTLAHESASSSAANRFFCPGGTDYALGPQESVLVLRQLEGLNVRWHVLGRQPAAGGGGGSEPQTVATLPAPSSASVGVAYLFSDLVWHTTGKEWTSPQRPDGIHPYAAPGTSGWVLRLRELARTVQASGRTLSLTQGVH